MKAQWIMIGNDHAGTLLKDKIKKKLIEKGYLLMDFGAFTENSVDYPDFAHPVANAMKERPESLGILICGSGNGMAISANKHPHIRAGIAWNSDVASLIKRHNDANILVLPARFIQDEIAIGCVENFLEASFEGGRHSQRVEKIWPYVC